MYISLIFILFCFLSLPLAPYTRQTWAVVICYFLPILFSDLHEVNYEKAHNTFCVVYKEDIIAIS